MRFFILGIAAAAVAFPQTKGPTTQQAMDCAQNFLGNNNTGTVTCYNVDKKLADQIGQLVTASKRDGKTLKDILDKLDVLRKELENQPPTTSITSFNQQGGITAGQVNITGPSAVKVSFAEVAGNQLEDGKDGTVYVSTIRVTLSGPVPQFTIAASASSLTKLDFQAQRTGMMSVVTGTTASGAQFHSMQNAYGVYLLTLRSKKPERFRVEYQCEGVPCVGP